MFSKIIYEKSFPPDPVLEALLKQQSADLYNEEQANFPSFQAMLEERERHTTYIRRPYRIRNRKRFINAAIVLSDFYEIDLTITQCKGIIMATFYFDACAAMANLNNIMGMADEFGFMTNIHGHDICLTLNYYTHRIFHNGILTSPK